MQHRQQQLRNKFQQYLDKVVPFRAVASGQLVRVVGLTLEASGCRAPVGSLCSIET
ncbi:MAG: flagellum-specific ATP synthase FliI, partial [Shewanella sp.]